MELAEGLRKIIERLRAKRQEPGFVLALGDRNSQPDSASAAVLSGTNTLDDFSKDGGKLCRTSAKLETTCRPDARNKAFLVDLFASRFRNFGEKYNVWSFKFKGHPRLYDEIYIPEDEAWIAQDDNGKPMLGVVSRPKRASDHSLMWVDLNW
jgi:hypothetical protein